MFFRKRTRKRKRKSRREKKGKEKGIKIKSETVTRRRRENGRGNGKETEKEREKNGNDGKKSGIEIGTSVNEIGIGTEIGIATNYEKRIGNPIETERKSEIMMKMKRWTEGGGRENSEREMRPTRR